MKSVKCEMLLVVFCVVLGFRLVLADDPVPFANKVEKILAHVFKNISYDQGTVFDYLLGNQAPRNQDPETMFLLRDHLEVSTLDVKTVQKIIEVARRKLLPDTPQPNVTVGQAKQLLEGRRDLNPHHIHKPNYSEPEMVQYDLNQYPDSYPTHLQGILFGKRVKTELYEVDDEQLPLRHVIMRRMRQYIYSARDYMGFTKPYRKRLDRNLEYRMGIVFGAMESEYTWASQIHSALQKWDIGWVRFIHYLIIYSKYLTFYTDIEYFVQTINHLHNQWREQIIGLAFKYDEKYKMAKSEYTHGGFVTDIEYEEDRQTNKTFSKKDRRFG